jgi:hypothetical protein
MKIIRNLLDTDLIPDIINLYRSSTNSVTLNGKITDRYVTPNRAMFLLSKYNQDEFKFIWDNIKDQLPTSKPEIFRILKYRKNNFAHRHIDSCKNDEHITNASLIIQLSDPKDYLGGEVIVGDELIELQPGDGVIYYYGEEHEVKKVKQGVRFVINIRIFNQDT